MRFVRSACAAFRRQKLGVFGILQRFLCLCRCWRLAVETSSRLWSLALRAIRKEVFHCVLRQKYTESSLCLSMVDGVVVGYGLSNEGVKQSYPWSGYFFVVASAAKGAGSS